MFTIGEFTFRLATELGPQTSAQLLRYERFVRELGLDKPRGQPEQLDRDTHDDDAIPLVATNRTGEVVGTLRVIPMTPRGLPGFAMAYPWKVDRFRPPAAPCQFSRLALDPGLSSAGISLAEELKIVLAVSAENAPTARGPRDRILSQRLTVTMGLVHLAAQVAHQLGATHLVAVSEPSIAPLLMDSPVRWDALGPESATPNGPRVYGVRVTDALPFLLSLRGRVEACTPAGERPAGPLPEMRLAAAEAFHLSGFDFFVATEGATLDQVFQLSRKVVPWSPEVRNVKPGRNPFEDIYDPWSIHMAATTTDGQVVGSFRLTLNSPVGLPSLEAARPEEQGRLGTSKKVAELSRLALAQPFAGAFVDVWSTLLSYPFPQPPEAPTQRTRKQAAMVTLGLFRLLYRISKSLRLTGWLLMLRPDTAEVLTHHGFVLRPIGPPADAGGRAPHLFGFREYEQSLFRFRNIQAVAADLSKLAKGGQWR